MTTPILVIEPNVVLGELYCRALEHEGYITRWCQNAQAAIASADQTKPRAVLLELQLAGHGGVEFLYEFRSYPEWHSIPVIILSLVPPAQLGISPLMMQQLNIATHLYKPLTNLEALTRTVNRLLAPTVP